MVLDFGLLSSGLFSSSDASGSGMGANKDTVVWNDVGIGIVPIGAVVAWLKSLTGCPALIPSFVECKGQVLADGDSPFNGRTIPNLNASGGGNKRFLRGSTTSGSVGGSEAHSHNLTSSADAIGTVSAGPTDSQNHLPLYYEVVWIMRIK